MNALSTPGSLSSSIQNGNLSGGMGFTLTWDAEDRVKSISYNGTQKRVEYDYDGQGRRARMRLVQSGVTNTEYLYIWDGLQILEKRDSVVPAFPLTMYFPQGERKFLSGTYLKYFYLKDRLGSIRGATSETVSIIQNVDFLPYGPTAPQQPIAADPDFDFTGISNTHSPASRSRPTACLAMRICSLEIL